ncbi:hypothetical protein TNCV_891081 [Trichonephila clavipes]|nr:hypothetical protein TNCV_891081 [Trichonephila clavipes]
MLNFTKGVSQALGPLEPCPTRNAGVLETSAVRITWPYPSRSIKPACHEFEPSTAEDSPYSGAGQSTLNMSKLKRPLVGVGTKRGGARSSVVLVTSLWFKTTNSVAKSPQVAE